MKYLLILSLLLLPSAVSAKVSDGGTHYKNNSQYDCSVTKKPSTPKWVTGIKKEKIGDRSITLTWDDSTRAHDVEIKYNGKMKKTGDDSKEKIKKLKNGKIYSFQVRGVSNCGKSGWSKVYKAQP